jgi:hypothetical protein
MPGTLDPYDPRGTWLAFEAESRAEGLDEKHARKMYLRWFVSQELATSIAPGLGTGSQAAQDVLVRWLRHDRQRLISHVTGAMSVCARVASIEPFTREQVADEINLVARLQGVDPC